MGRVRFLDEGETPSSRLRFDEPPAPSLSPEQYGPPAELMQPPNVPMDVAKSVGSGIERGLVGLPGIPTDIARLAQLGWLWSQGKLYGPEHRQRMEALTQQGTQLLPGSGEIIEAAKPYVPGLDYEPQTPAGEIGQTVGEFLPGAVVPGQLALRGAGLGARAGRAALDAVYQGVAPGVAAEGAEAAAKGTRFEPIAAPAAAVATSLATGRLPLPRAATAVPGYSPGAASRVNRAIEDEGGHAAVGAELQQLGPEGRLMDVGPNLTGQAEALVSSPGRAQSELLRVVRDRNNAAGDRIATGVDRVVGDPVNFAAETETLLGQRRLRAARFYGQAEGHTQPIDTTPVVQHINRQLPQEATQQPTQIERALINAREVMTGRSDMRSLHNVKESLDDQIAAAVRTNEGGLARQLGQVRDQLVRQIDAGTTVPGPNGQPVSLYRQAREAYAGDSAILRAREEGLAVFNRDVDPNVVARENLARTEAERIAFQGGAREALVLKMDNARNDALAVRNLFETRANRGKLNQIVGQEGANDLLNILRQETRLAGTERTPDLTVGDRRSSGGAEGIPVRAAREQAALAQRSRVADAGATVCL